MLLIIRGNVYKKVYNGAVMNNLMNKMLAVHAIDRVDQRGEFPATVEACSLMHVFLFFGMMFKDFAQGGVAV